MVNSDRRLEGWQCLHLDGQVAKLEQRPLGVSSTNHIGRSLCIKLYNMSNMQNYKLYTKHGEPGWLSRYSDWLWVGRSGDLSRWGVRISAPVHTGPGTNPVSHTMGTGSFPGVTRPRRGVVHPTPSSAAFKERVEL
jgi:hypothetical protein